MRTGRPRSGPSTAGPPRAGDWRQPPVPAARSGSLPPLWLLRLGAFGLLAALVACGVGAAPWHATHGAARGAFGYGGFAATGLLTVGLLWRVERRLAGGKRPGSRRRGTDADG